jgi:hypothetical protein
MNKAISILVVAVLIASGMHMSIDRHYCGGALADVKISVTGKLASCGMEQTESDRSNYPLFDQKCCEDQLSYILTSGNYCPESFRIPFQVSEKEIIFKTEESFISYNLCNPDEDSRVFPPGDRYKRLNRSEICVFRI